MDKEKEEKTQNLTLMGYYEGLPKSSFPKKDFVLRIMQECDVSFATANNWVRGVTKPKTEKQKERLSEITGIPKEELWK